MIASGNDMPLNYDTWLLIYGQGDLWRQSSITANVFGVGALALPALPFVATGAGTAYTIGVNSYYAFGAAITTAGAAIATSGGDPSAAAAEVAQTGTLVTEEGLAAITNHLTNTVPGAIEAPENQFMLQALNAGEYATGAYENFYLHELEEAEFMSQGLSYETAHPMTLDALGHSPFSLYAPEIIEQMGHAYWNPNWFDYWGLK
jgi:filamentous hemagglutinin